MNYSLEWLMKLKIDYMNSMDIVPFSPSDWNNNDNTIKFPLHVIEKAMENNKDHHKYTFMYDLISLKKSYSDFIKKHLNYDIDTKNISISQNSTSSIYLSIQALFSKQIKRFLVVTPTYFSILDAIKSDKTANIYYYHLKDINDFEINLNKLKKIINEQYIECLIITDPIFCTSKEINIKILDQLVQICNEKNIWLVYDYTLGNIYFNKDNSLFNISKLKIVQKTKKYIFIESISKRIFMNGIKNSIIFASKQIIPKIESVSNYINGGFSSSQLSFFNEIYNENNIEYLDDIFIQNKKTIKDNYNIIKTLLLNTNYDIYSLESGYYTTIYHKNYKLENLNIEDITKKILYDANTFVIPNCRFSFYKTNHFGFRINLSKNKEYLIKSISNTIKVNI